MEARGYPFNKKGVLCCCCIPVPLQPHLLTLQLQLEALQDLPFPYQCNPALNEIRTQKSSSERGLSFQLLPGEHACKWLSFLLAQCKFFSVGISVWCCFAAWSWQGFVAQKGQKLCQVKLQMYDPTTCQSKSLCRLIYSAFSPHDDDGCTPSSKHWGTPKCSSPLCTERTKTSVISGAGKEYCKEILLTNATHRAINWHSLTPCIHLHMFKWIRQVLMLKLAQSHLCLYKHTQLC